MAFSLAHLKRMESKKSHSWWWDSHISPKNSRWLFENLEEMDQKVKSMLKLIEEDGDSFAKKAEMYYQKRPELIARVEEFYRLYRSLAERYDHVTGELRKNVPSDLHSQGSGISDAGSEPPSVLPSPDVKPSRRKSGHRAAGFEYFLGSAGGTNPEKDGYESSSVTESDTESDVSSVNNYSGPIGNWGDQMGNRKIIDLEIELREVREQSETKNAAYEQDLRNANAKIQHSEEEIARLKIELNKYNSAEHADNLQGELKSNQASEFHDGSESDTKDRELVKELRIAKERLQHADEEISNLKRELEKYISSEKMCSLREQVESLKKESAMWKTKLNTEKREVSKLQERINRLKASLLDRDQEMRGLKTSVSDAEEKIFPEKAQIKAEISGLLEERKHFEENLREWESRGRLLEEEIRKIKSEKTEIEQRLSGEIEQLKLEVSSKDVCIEEMERHLRELHMEHVELIAGSESAKKVIENLKVKNKEVEDEVERQRVLILEGAEEKREAIRQLCFSLEHYRNGYNTLRVAFQSHRRLPTVLAS